MSCHRTQRLVCLAFVVFHHYNLFKDNVKNVYPQAQNKPGTVTQKKRKDEVTISSSKINSGFFDCEEGVDFTFTFVQVVYLKD